MAKQEIEVVNEKAVTAQIKKIVSERALNRRTFMAALGMTGAAAGAGLLSGCSNNTSPVLASTVQQSDVLNFALNLEYLEATFYAYITTGADIPTTLSAGSGAITNPPAKVTFPTQQITDLINEIAYDEINHVADLRSVLGTIAVVRPAINFAAYAAITATNALSVARLFEDVGVTAYAGAANLLSSTNLTYAAQILAVEAFHSGALRLIAIQNPTIAAYLKPTTTDTIDVPYSDPGTAALAAAGPTAAAGGFFATSGAGTANGQTPAGFAFTRTTSQVLAIVYAAAGVAPAAGVAKGGFFPSGVNGLINTI